MPRTPLRMPKLSMTMAEGELVAWRVDVGRAVRAGDVVCEVLTDKVDMEVEAPVSGTLVGIDVPEGETVAVGTPLAWIETESDSLVEDLVDPPPTAAPPVPAPAPVPGRGIVPAIPGARRLAAEHGLSLECIPGSGPGGAVMVSDVRTLLTSGTDPVRPPEVTTAPAGDDPAGDALGDVWAARAEALRPRPRDTPAAGITVWQDVVLGPGEPPSGGGVLGALLRATSAALAERGPARVLQRPRVAALLPTPAGELPVTLTAPHDRSAGDVATELTAALSRARSGLVDLQHLAPPDATVTWLDGVDRIAVPTRPGAVVAVAAGAARQRPVATGLGVGVRSVMTMSATVPPGTGAADAAALVARIAALLVTALMPDERHPQRGLGATFDDDSTLDCDQGHTVICS